MVWPRAPLLLAAATFAAALALGARAWQAHFRTEPVLRVRREVPAGAPLDPGAVEVVAIPLGGRPPGALASPDQVRGRWARVPLVPGEYLLEAHTRAAPPPRALAERKAPGALALSIPVRPEAALLGALQVGDLVQAYAALPAAQGGPRLVAHGLRVLDVRSAEGASIAGEAPPRDPGAPLSERPLRAVPAAVVLEVSPEQALALLEAVAARADIYLAVTGRSGG